MAWVHATCALFLCAGRVGDAVSLHKAKQPSGLVQPSGLASQPGDPAAPSPAAPAHFLAHTYNQVRSSGDGVSSAVQGILTVESSLNDLKLDLGTEYGRWQSKQAALVSDRNRYEREIKTNEVELLHQGKLKAEAVRLAGDLALLQRANHDANATHTQALEKWREKEEELMLEIQSLVSDIATEQREKNVSIAAMQALSEKQRLQQLNHTKQILETNRTVQQLKEARAKHGIVAAKEQGELLKQQDEVVKELHRVQAAVEDQQKLVLAHNRLADKAREVAQLREEVVQDKQGCSDTIRTLNAQLARIAESKDADTNKLRECQAMDAENVKLQDKANKCRAALRAR